MTDATINFWSCNPLSQARGRVWSKYPMTCVAPSSRGASYVDVRCIVAKHWHNTLAWPDFSFCQIRVCSEKLRLLIQGVLCLHTSYRALVSFNVHSITIWRVVDANQWCTSAHHNMGTLSQMNTETLTRKTILLFGEHESCMTHAHSWHPQYMYQCIFCSGWYRLMPTL